MLPFAFAVSIGTLALAGSCIYSVRVLVSLVPFAHLPRPLQRLITVLGMFRLSRVHDSFITQRNAMSTTKSKPALVFFQSRYDHRLPEFLSIHRREHVKCLSVFFDVTVIDNDCDYGQVCDLYQPDLALFEGAYSGISFSLCRPIKITNVHSHPRVPKVGFHNAKSMV